MSRAWVAGGTGPRIRDRYGYRQFTNFGVVVPTEPVPVRGLLDRHRSAFDAVRPRGILAARRQGGAARPVGTRTRRSRGCGHARADRHLHSGGWSIALTPEQRERLDGCGPGGGGGWTAEPARPAARRAIPAKRSRDRPRGQARLEEVREHRSRGLPEARSHSRPGKADVARAVRVCAARRRKPWRKAPRRSPRRDPGRVHPHAGSLGRGRRDRPVRRGLRPPCSPTRGTTAREARIRIAAGS